MVHPDYWRRGIFEALGRYGIERVRKENGRFLIAFPIRQETIHGLKKIGWKEVVKLPVLVYPIRFSGIINRYLHFPLLSLVAGGVVRFLYVLCYRLKRRNGMEKIEIEEMGSLDDQFDHFWQEALSLYPIIGVRNRNYLTWRYLQHPTRTYTIYRAKKSGEMKGYIVLRKVDLLNFNSAVIVDLLALDEVTLTALVERGIQHSRQKGTDLLAFMVPGAILMIISFGKEDFSQAQKLFNLWSIFIRKEKYLILRRIGMSTGEIPMSSNRLEGNVSVIRVPIVHVWRNEEELFLLACIRRRFHAKVFGSRPYSVQKRG